MIKAIQNLQEMFPNISFRDDVYWRDITTIQAGNAKILLAEPQNDIALAQLLQYCSTEEISTMVIGCGCNTIGQDDLYNGIVIRLCKPAFCHLNFGRFHVTAGAGLSLNELIAQSKEHNFGGIAELSGIPGSIGGTLWMNAGANGKTIGQFVSEICGVYHDGTPWIANRHEIKWGYRSSSIPEDVIVTAAIFRLPRSAPETETAKINLFQKKRSKTNPKGLSAGCAFKNISSTDTAGKIIEESGCKGIHCGGAAISRQHANFIINSNQASEYDVLNLMIKVREKVARQTGFYLQPEYCFVNDQSKHKLLNSPPCPKVTVLKGGNSNERPVSLESGEAVSNALRKSGYHVNEIDITELSVTQTMCEADIIFPVLHGGFGENGDLQLLLENNNIKFVGCGSKASAIIFDKIKSKRLMDSTGIPTPNWGIITPDNKELPVGLYFPVILKPPREGSTLGIFLIESADEWDTAVTEAFKFDANELLVEQYISGAECTIGIANGIPLPMVEIIPPGKMYDYDAKYTHNHGDTQYLCPPKNITSDQQHTAEKIAMQYFHATGAEGILRVDFIITENDDYYVLEGNNLPGFTASSLLPKAAAAFGWSFEKLCSQLISHAV